MLLLFTSTLLASQTVAEEYFISTDTTKNAIKCIDGADSICNIYCDEKKQDNIVIDCGNSKECNFYCEEQKCAENANIIATNSSNLNVILTDTAQECMKNAKILAPNYGNATFDMGNSKKGFKNMKVYGGRNTQNIMINAESDKVYGDDLKDMEIYASTSNYVQISLGDGIEWENGILECPIPPIHNYNYYQQPPCTIYGSNAILKNTHIIAYGGIPTNIYIEDGIIYEGANTITCNSVNVQGVSTSPFDSNSKCWYTSTTSSYPTYYPTHSPTDTTYIPTYTPTNTPTYTPTNTPTYTPTNTPTYIPTYSPTDSTINPTISTNNPTYYPSKMPTTIPTLLYTTDSPTVMPSHSTLRPSTSSPISTTKFATAFPTHTPTENILVEITLSNVTNITAAIDNNSIEGESTTGYILDSHASKNRNFLDLLLVHTNITWA
eukprot:287735_1